MASSISRREFVNASAAVAASALSGATFAQAQPVTGKCTFVGWGPTEAPSRDHFENVFKTFRSANPGVDLEVIAVPFNQVETTLNLRRRSGQRVDVAQLQDFWMPALASAGGLIDVDEALGSKYATDNFIPAALPITMVRGKRVGLPIVSGSALMVANLKTLEEAGISKLPETMDQFVEALRTVKKAKPGSSPFGLSTKPSSLVTYEAQIFLLQFGARIFGPNDEITVDSSASREALGFLAGLVRDGLLLPGNDRFDFRRMFSREQVAFYIDAPGARGFARAQSGQGEAYDRYVQPMAMPVLRRGDAPMSLQWGHNLGFFSWGGAKLAADSPSWRLAQHLLKPETQLAYFRAVGLFPTSVPAIAELKNDGFLNNWLNLTRSPQPNAPLLYSNGVALSDIVGEEIAAAVLGQKTPDAAVVSMASRLRAAKPTR